ncbi:sterol desaturase family protein [Lysobacter silvisoli]|uniref:Sterol desaturase family protein n=1 Tax=Lysobacter silvisoli TaxID=2293254 RepID=A0A371K009_9GAMM|nr:sterol desaturase family protein [Lysobacter silvisoli]RDZ27255.1 sterol desaturase family protein [Lysobacter silvisoli]
MDRVVLQSRSARAVERWAHPLLLAALFALWWALGHNDPATLMIFPATLIVAAALEAWVPAQPQWHLGVMAQLRLWGVYALALLASALMLNAYESLLVPALSGLRDAGGGNLWPDRWPLPLQVALLFFAADLLYYWAHRAIHRWAWLWRATGHGFHHGFHNLHAINAGSNHPFEVVLLILPLLLLASVTDAPPLAVDAAGMLLVANAVLAHANVSMRTPGFSWLVTSSNHHRRHHSAVFEDSNTNYACNAIVWDRLFGTYSEGPVAQTGIGPSQPGLWRMYLLPFREPGDADTVASRAQERGER